MEFDFHENYDEENENEYTIDKEHTFKRSTDISVQDFRDYYYNKFISESNQQQAEEPCEKKSYKTKIIDTFINIDSRNRDIQKYPKQNNYVILLDREYTNVKEVKIVSTQFPNINRNIFKDPRLLRNDGIYWQRYNENNLKIFDYSYVSNDKISFYLNDITIEILDYLFEGTDDILDVSEITTTTTNDISNIYEINEIDDENTCRYLIKEMMKVRKNEFNVYEISFQEFIDVEQDDGTIKMFEKFNLMYAEKYIKNKIIKITLNELFNGNYKVQNFSLRFYSFGENWKDCFVLLGVNCLNIDPNLILDFESLNIPAKDICVEYYGNFQILPNKSKDDNNTFETHSAEIDSGFYDDTNLSKELSNKMTQDDPDEYEFDVSINERKNLSNIRCFKKKNLGNDCLFFRPYFPILDRLINGKKKNFTVIFKSLLHKFVENDTVVFRVDKKKKFDLPNLNIMSSIKEPIYEKEFRVHMCKFEMLEVLDKYILYEDTTDEIHDISFEKSYVHFPICHNFFYIDLMEHFSRDTCENLFSGTESVGIGYSFKKIKKKKILGDKLKLKFSQKSPLSCFGDLIINYEKIKLINRTDNSLQSFIGFSHMDSSDFFVKRCYRQPHDSRLFYSQNHKLFTKDVIYINNTKIIVKYISDDYFSIENQQLKNADKYFYNTNPIYFYGNSILNNFLEENHDEYTETDINTHDILVHENKILFQFKKIPSLFFSKNDMFECFNYPGVPIALKNITNQLYYYFVSVLDNKPLKNFWGQNEKYTFSRKKIIRFTYYNHQLTTGVNDIKLHGFSPINGSYPIFKINKDQFSIMSKFNSDDGIYKKNKNFFNPFTIEMTSDYSGFKDQIKNTDFFGNTKSAINFESSPYILCTSSVLGGNIQNIYNNGNNNRVLPLQELTNVFMKLNMPEKSLKMVYDRFVQVNKTFPTTPLPSLSFIDLQFWYPSGVAYDFQDADHSFVLLIREYYDYNNDINYSTKRGNTDDINTFPQVVYQNK